MRDFRNIMCHKKVPLYIAGLDASRECHTLNPRIREDDGTPLTLNGAGFGVTHCGSSLAYKNPMEIHGTAATITVPTNSATM